MGKYFPAIDKKNTKINEMIKYFYLITKTLKKDNPHLKMRVPFIPKCCAIEENNTP